MDFIDDIIPGWTIKVFIEDIIDCYDPIYLRIFYPVAYPIRQIVADLPVPLVTYCLDTIPGPTAKTLIFIVLFILQQWSTEYSFLFQLFWAQTTYIIAKLLWFNGFFAVYSSFARFSPAILQTLDVYIFFDGPVVEIVGKWRLQLLQSAIYTFSCLSIYQPKTTYIYLTRHIQECDVVSACLLIHMCIPLVFWSFVFDGIPAKVFELRDWIRNCKDQVLVLRLKFLHDWKWSLRNNGEEFYKETIDYNTIPDYTYHHLEPGQIRLLKVKSRPALHGFLVTELISCSLEAAKNHNYEALSYTWQGELSSGPNSHGILVDGERLSITPNLHKLLLARRQGLKDKDRYVWVDAICINQADNVEEKPAQLRMMKDIYANASQVVGWLGDDWDACLAAEMIVDIDATSKIFDWNEMQFYDNFRWNKDGPRWQAFVKAIRHDYFSRAWICQEIVLGKNFRFYIGGHYILWSTFRNTITHVNQLGTSSLFQKGTNLPSPKTDYFLNNTIMLSCLRDLSWASQFPLAILLSMFARLQATDPRDKIYALLGLSNTDLSRSIKPEYERNQCAVFTDVAIMLLNSEENAAAILPHAGIGYPGVAEELPTWVPDWSSESQKESLLLAIHFPEGNFMADAELFSNLGHTLKVPKYTASGLGGTYFFTSNDKRHLLVIAISVDVVARVSDPLVVSNDIRAYKDWIDQAERLFGSSSPPADIDPEAFWRTLIADRSRTTHPAPAKYGNFYQVFRACMKLDGSWPPTPEKLEQFKQLVDSNFRPGRSNLGAAYPVLDAILSYANQFRSACYGHSFGTTGNSRVGLVPPRTCPGDLICIIFGLQTPYILRPDSAKPGVYKLVGECYVHGMMEGEMVTSAIEPKIFTIA